MTRRTSLGLFAACAALSAAWSFPHEAHACGGCFSQSNGESTIVTAHRMALSVSTDRTVLWDQIQYQGNPEEFAWVLPVKPGTTVDLASDAFFEALDAATSVHANPPSGITCNQGVDDGYDGGYTMGCAISGCASEGVGAIAGQGGDTGIGFVTPPVPPVEVVHEDSIGPYESVVLSSNKPGALYDWLVSHGYGIDASMEPVVDAYEANGFDFVALRLIPGANTRQMKPVRVISPGAAPVLPLRMVAAGAGANVAMTLFVIGEGRWEAQSFSNSQVNTGSLVWDFAANGSNYSSLRQAALATSGGAVWLSTFAQQGALFYPKYNPVSMSNVSYQASSGVSAETIAALYVDQGQADGEYVDTTCTVAFQSYAGSVQKVVDTSPPDETGGAGGTTSTGGSGGAGGATSTGGASAGGMGGAGNTGGGGGANTGGGGTGGAANIGGGGAGGVANTGGSPGTGGAANTGGAPSTGSLEDTCVHSVCAPAGPLVTGCNPCVTQICHNDAYCCDTAWDSICVNEVASICGQDCWSGSGDPGSGDPGSGQPGDIDASAFVCGDLDDLAVALVGMHPAYVWVTRLEANLPKAALSTDLALQPAPQIAVENWLQAPTYTGDPCAGQAASPAVPRRSPPDEPRRRPPLGTGDLLAIGFTLAALLGAAARRALRKTPSLS